MHTTRTPRWAKWRLVPEVALWEAVALSLNVEPTRISKTSSAWMGAPHPFEEGQEFDDRLEVLRANRSNSSHFPTACSLNMSGSYLCGVALSEFASFAKDVAQWSIPHELAEIAARSIALHESKAEQNSAQVEGISPQMQGPEFHYSIELPTGAQYIDAWRLAKKIAEAVPQSRADNPARLKRIGKLISDGPSGHYREEELSQDDLMELRNISGSEIEIPLNMSRNEWIACRDAFMGAPNRPNWEPVGYFSDGGSSARDEQWANANEHVQTMNELIRKEKIRAFDSRLIPLARIGGWGAQIPMEDARAYIKHLGFRTTDADGSQIINDSTKRRFMPDKGTLHKTRGEPREHRLASYIRAAQDAAVQTTDEAARWRAAPVWAELRNQALEETGPFTGADSKGLHYTDGKNKARCFTREALAAYLKRRRTKL